jgi:NAD(P)-dependent dehydrogenase (short-subunit alcohol dehydrogenase family)
VGDYDQVHAVVDQIIKDFGKIDVFIANAGRTAHGGVLEESVSDWQEVMNTDLTGVYCCARAVGFHFKERKNGSFIITASMSGHIANYPQEQVRALLNPSMPGDQALTLLRHRTMLPRPDAYTWRGLWPMNGEISLV